MSFKKAYFSRLLDATFQILIFLSPEAVAIFAPQGDQHIPVSQGRELALANPRAHYIEMRGEDHITLPLRLDLLAGVVDDWMARDEHHPKSACPAPQLPAQAGWLTHT